MVIAALAGLYTFQIAFSKSLRIMYPIEADGTVNDSGPGTVVDLGIAIYAYGLGAAVALVLAL